MYPTKSSLKYYVNPCELFMSGFTSGSSGARLDVVVELLEFDCIKLKGTDVIESILDPDLEGYE